MKLNKKRRPWNTVSEQIYSLSSVSKNGVNNMNIATYVTPVTMKPKRYLIAIYRGTKTHDNIFKTNKPFLLQALSESQFSLVKIFGKKSGLKVNKENLIKKKKLNFKHYNSLIYLTDCYFVLYLLPENYFKLGDHDLVVARVEKIVLQNHVSELTTRNLQTLGIIG